MKNILISVDLTDMDEVVIRYAYFLKEQWNVASVNFVHNIRTYDIDDTLKDLLGTKDIKAIVQKNLKTKIAKVFKDESTYTLNVFEHDNTEYILKNWAEKNNINTIMLGFKQKDSGTAAMSQKLIRIFKGDILLIPSNARLQWSRVLIPTDLGAMLHTVIKKTRLILDHETNPEIRIMKTFHIPSLFFPFMDIDDSAAIEQSNKHINKQYAEVKKKYAIGESYSFVARYQDDQSVVDLIQKESKKFNADLIMMAAKGDSNITSLLIGSTINELINTPPFQAIYILK